jgi:hypothetical protein
VPTTGAGIDWGLTPTKEHTMAAVTTVAELLALTSTREIAETLDEWDREPIFYLAEDEAVMWEADDLDPDEVPFWFYSLPGDES